MLLLSSILECGDFSLIRALDCRKGGLVTQRHKVRNVLGDLAALGYRKVVREPIMSDRTEDFPALLAGSLDPTS